MITKNNRPKPIWVDQGTEIAGYFKKFCVAEVKHVYSTMSETKAIFTEKTNRSLKKILYGILEEHEYKYSHKLSQFVKILNSTTTRTTNRVPNKVKISDFMSILYGQPIRELTPLKFSISDKVCISKIDIPFRKCYEPRFTEEVFEIVAHASRKPPKYTVKDNQNLLIRGKFYEKEMIRVIWEWIISQWCWSQTHPLKCFWIILWVFSRTSLPNKST